MPRRALVVGGARSGKSTWAEQQLRDTAEVDYVATSVPYPDDPEWAERVRLHRERRPASWRTVETGDVAAVLRADGPPVLVDCLTLWITRVMDEAGAWSRGQAAGAEVERRIDDLAAAVAQTGRDVVLVSNEVGSGIVPADAGSRLFRDLLGICNARVAAACDEVWVCHVGIARRWR